MDPEFVVPYIVSHVVAVMYVLIAWRWPGVARRLFGGGFLIAGAFNIWTVSTAPHSYVQGFGPHAFPLYREFIYGAFARHTAAFMLPFAGGQLAVGSLAFAPLPWRKLAYAGAIIFLLAITPLGIGSAAPSTLIFAAGMVVLLRARQPA